MKISYITEKRKQSKGEFSHWLPQSSKTSEKVVLKYLSMLDAQSILVWGTE